MKATLNQIKTDESVWPEGATHWVRGDFHRYTGNKRKSGCILNGNHWEDWKLSLEYFEMTGAAIIPRPTKAFVPEVGKWCEHMHALGYEKSFIIGRNKKGEYVFQNDKSDCYYTDTKECFRPIKSERDLVIEEALVVLNKNPTAMPNELLGMLYEEGMLQLKEPTK